MVMTSVTGHIAGIEFKPPHNRWGSCAPDFLFGAAIESTVAGDKMALKGELEKQAKKASILVLWLDCDREGEAIADEVDQICKKANGRLQTFRAQFSAVMPGEVTKALSSLRRVNQHLVDAVNARQEIDLRIGAAFTRFQTKRYQDRHNIEGVISYGPCQFPTLGFVVERWARIETFVPEDFYAISLSLRDPENPSREVPFQWSRTKLFDRVCTLALYQNCLRTGFAMVQSTEGRRQNRWRPIPLATVELQKRASKYCRISSEDCMKAAEKLYTDGIISYPRTETEKVSCSAPPSCCSVCDLFTPSAPCSYAGSPCSHRVCARIATLNAHERSAALSSTNDALVRPLPLFTPAFPRSSRTSLTSWVSSSCSGTIRSGATTPLAW